MEGDKRFNIMKLITSKTLPLKNIKWENYITLIAQVNAELARYEGLVVIFLKLVNTFIYLYQQACQASRRSPNRWAL